MLDRISAPDGFESISCRGDHHRFREAILETVTTSYAKKTVEVSPKVQHQALAHQLLEEMVKAEKARKGSTL